MVVTKICTKCKVEKPRSDFYQRPERGPNAVRSKCMDCSNSARQAKRLSVLDEEKERALELARKWKRDNHERCLKKKRWNGMLPILKRLQNMQGRVQRSFAHGILNCVGKGRYFHRQKRQIITRTKKLNGRVIILPNAAQNTKPI